MIRPSIRLCWLLLTPFLHRGNRWTRKAARRQEPEFWLTRDRIGRVRFKVLSALYRGRHSFRERRTATVVAKGILRAILFPVLLAAGAVVLLVWFDRSLLPTLLDYSENAGRAIHSTGVGFGVSGTGSEGLGASHSTWRASGRSACSAPRYRCAGHRCFPRALFCCDQRGRGERIRRRSPGSSICTHRGSGWQLLSQGGRLHGRRLSVRARDAGAGILVRSWLGRCVCAFRSRFGTELHQARE